MNLLLEHRAYVSLTTIIVCSLDALAAGSGKATRGKFEHFITKHFPELCSELENVLQEKKGAATFYDAFRNGFAHLRGPKTGFAIAENHELGGAFADELEVDGIGKFVAVNLDRLAREFLALLVLFENTSSRQ